MGAGYGFLFVMYVSLYVYIYIYMICIYIYIYIYIYIWGLLQHDVPHERRDRRHLSLYTLYIYIYIYIGVCMYICIYIYIYTYTWTNSTMCLMTVVTGDTSLSIHNIYRCIYVYICVYIYIYTHELTARCASWKSWQAKRNTIYLSLSLSIYIYIMYNTLSLSLSLHIYIYIYIYTHTHSLAQCTSWTSWQAKRKPRPFVPRRAAMRRMRWHSVMLPGIVVQSFTPCSMTYWCAMSWHVMACRHIHDKMGIIHWTWNGADDISMAPAQGWRPHTMRAMARPDATTYMHTCIHIYTHTHRYACTRACPHAPRQHTRICNARACIRQLLIAHHKWTMMFHSA